MTPLERSELYKSLFLNTPAGTKVLEDLSGIFYDREVFVRGGVDAARATDFNLGSRSVVRFIYKQLNKLEEVILDGSNDTSSDPT